MRHVLLFLVALAAACGPGPSTTNAIAEAPQSVLLITIDTLRADAVGAYGKADARTPALDQLAREGLRVDRAWAAAPITLPSHASILSGRYPPSHGSRHNGIAMTQAVPTLATVFQTRGMATAAFVSAFPLDRRFGLARGFDVYDDEMPRPQQRAPLNERPGRDTATRAAAWLEAHRRAPFFLWVHLFDPHAPYGSPGDGRTALSRYADEVAASDQQVGQLLRTLGDAAPETLVIVTADHGEAFGEHGEVGHSVFIYDTTLRVPLILSGPGVPRSAVITQDVSLVDLAPTVLALTRSESMDVDGRSLIPALDGGALGAREIYAESFAPTLDFGWAGLRGVREGSWKYIAAPRPELFDVRRDPGEQRDQAADQNLIVARLDAVAARWSGPELAAPVQPASESAARLRSLGYLQGAPGRVSGQARRADPKDRIALASRLAEVTSGEVQGAKLISTLAAILREDPGNPQAHLRLGYAHKDRGACSAAETHFTAAIRAGLPSADAALGLADCRAQAGDVAGAAAALALARAAEPGNPVVAANLGLLALEQNRLTDAIAELRSALKGDPLLFQARFALARALARSGDRAQALSEAQTLIGQLPANAPQRAEVVRLIQAIRQ